MKPVSVIFLIVAAVMMITGLVICTVATVQAKSSDIALFDSQYNANNELEYIYSYGNQDVSKIKVDVDTADIEIICGAEYDRIEVINFPSAQYICEVQNKALVMESGINLFSLTDIAQGNIHFKGLRHYLKDRNYDDKPRRITIYVSPASNIKIFDIATEKGNVKISGYTNSSDYTFEIKNGTLNMDNITTDSNIKINIEEGNANITNVTASYVTAQINKGDFNTILSAKEIDASVGTGNIIIKSGDNLEDFNYDLAAPLGMIDLNGLTKKGVYNAYDATNVRKIKAKSGSGNITVQSYKDLNLPETVVN